MDIPMDFSIDCPGCGKRIKVAGKEGRVPSRFYCHHCDRLWRMMITEELMISEMREKTDD